MQTTTKPHQILKSPKRKVARRDESLPSPPVRVLSLLDLNGGEMPRRWIRDRLHLVYRFLDPVLDDLEKEGKIKITLGEKSGIVSLKKKYRQRSKSTMQPGDTN